ncbi:MAG: chemotaxis protein CheW [Candidatus Acidiferrum sp.]|jgi:purine-binding chemotaxis protein CheW
MAATITTESLEEQQYLTFRISQDEYAVGIPYVREIIEYSAVTRVPQAPAWIRGVINVRGSVVPVVDLAVKFGMTESPLSKTTCIIILEIKLDGEDSTMGVLADAVNEVTSFTAEQIEQVPSFGTRVGVAYLLGMVKVGSKFALMMDIHKVLSGEEFASLGELPSQAVKAETDSAQKAGAKTAVPSSAIPRSGKSNS